MSARDLLWLVVLALLAYATLQFLRALRAPRRVDTPATARAPAAVTRAETGARPEAGGAGDPGDDEDEGDFDYAPIPAAAGVAAAEAAAPGREDARAEVFTLELENSRLRQALQAQKDLVALQQQEIARLVEDLTTLQDEAEQARVRPAASPSPEYSEAMMLAAQGLNAEMIAARCGITLAEAELVLSLARRGERGA